MKVFKVTKGDVNYDKIINDDGVEFLFSPIGASIVHIKDGINYLTRNALKSFDFATTECYHGKTIGRVANRMRGNQFKINGKQSFVSCIILRAIL